MIVKMTDNLTTQWYVELGLYVKTMRDNNCTKTYGNTTDY